MSEVPPLTDYKPPKQVHVLPRTPQLLSLLTELRSAETPRADFIHTADRIIRLLVEEALNHLPFVPVTVKTPIGATYKGLKPKGGICGVSIMRAGESMETALRECCRAVRIGKILIQRNEETKQPQLFYAKLPPDVADRFCLLLDPMLATGGSAIKAVEVLLDHGVKESNIVFVNLISVPEGIENMLSKYPALLMVTAEIDTGLDDDRFITPGLGDFGCLYFGTVVKTDI